MPNDHPRDADPLRLHLGEVYELKEDFAVLTAVYSRAYVEAPPTYVVADHYLYDVTVQGTSVISTGCKAV